MYCNEITKDHNDRFEIEFEKYVKKKKFIKN